MDQTRSCEAAPHEGDGQSEVQQEHGHHGLDNKLADHTTSSSIAPAVDGGIASIKGSLLPPDTKDSARSDASPGTPPFALPSTAEPSGAADGPGSVSPISSGCSPHQVAPMLRDDGGTAIRARDTESGDTALDTVGWQKENALIHGDEAGTLQQNATYNVPYVPHFVADQTLSAPSVYGHARAVVGGKPMHGGTGSTASADTGEMRVITNVSQYEVESDEETDNTYADAGAAALYENLKPEAAPQKKADARIDDVFRSVGEIDRWLGSPAAAERLSRASLINDTAGSKPRRPPRPTLLQKTTKQDEPQHDMSTGFAATDTVIRRPPRPRATTVSGHDDKAAKRAANKAVRRPRSESSAAECAYKVVDGAYMDDVYEAAVDEDLYVE